MNTLTIHHQNGDRKFRLEKGGYAFEDDGISIAVETEAEEAGFPNWACFYLANYPLQRACLKEGLVLRFKDNHDEGTWNEQATHANAYFEFSAEMVDLAIEILSVQSKIMTVRLSAITEDIDYYDDRARPTTSEGIFQLQEKAKSEL
jgi:hypothetical protein